MQSIIISNLSNVKPKQNNEIRLDFNSSLELKGKQIALAYLGLYYSWRNITLAFNNHFFQYRWVDGNVYDVDVSDGFYSINELSGYLQFKMFQNGHYVLDADGQQVFAISFESNPTYYCVTFDMFPVVIPMGGSNPNAIPAGQLGKVPQLIVSENGVREILGVNAGSYPASASLTSVYSFNGPNVPQVSPITTINIACNLVRNSMNRYQQVIYQFAPTTQYGSYITLSSLFPIFYEVLDGSYDSISLTFYDQNYRSIQIIDPTITATLLIKGKTAA